MDKSEYTKLLIIVQSSSLLLSFEVQNVCNRKGATQVQPHHHVMQSEPAEMLYSLLNRKP